MLPNYENCVSGAPTPQQPHVTAGEEEEEEPSGSGVYTGTKEKLELHLLFGAVF